MEGSMVQMLGLALVLLVGYICGEVVKTQKCYLSTFSQQSCTIHEVRITPCPEAAENKPCKVKLGTNASLSFDFTPNFSATNMGSQVYKVNPLVDTPFELMDTNGCKYTQCPVEANKKQIYDYALEVGKQFPADLHQIKWKLWNSENHHEQCCFKYTVQLAN